MTHEPPASVERIIDDLAVAFMDCHRADLVQMRRDVMRRFYERLSALSTPPARPGREEIARLEAALRLARNRLQAHAIDSIARGDKHSFEHGEWADHATAALSARIKRGDCPFVAGPVWQDDECWTSEVQVVGGHAVVLTVHGATKAEVIARRDACILALFDGASA